MSRARFNGVRRLGARLVARLLPSAAPLLLFALFAAQPAAAQTVTGRVIGGTDGSGGEPLRGALVTVLDANGKRVRGVLTNATGAFSIAVPEPGHYRLRAEMIGRETVEADAEVAAGGNTNVQLALPARPIELDGVEVTAASRCSVRGEQAVVTLRVWEEIQKALRAEEATREMAMYEFDIRRARRTLNPGTYGVMDEQVQTGKSVANKPFTTLTPQQIAEEGYVRTENARTRIYGPNTEVLLSVEFQDTHCFSLKQQRDQVGLVFKPVSGRKVTDIEGVLWVDSETGELDKLEFKYKRIPYGLATGPYSGFLEFQRLESGAWIIGRWRLSTPVSEEEAEVTSLEPVLTRELTEATDEKPATPACVALADAQRPGGAQAQGQTGSPPICPDAPRPPRP